MLPLEKGDVPTDDTSHTLLLKDCRAEEKIKCMVLILGTFSAKRAITQYQMT